jgi:aerobic carbon-monoxide dehydrogenase large subunit
MNKALSPVELTPDIGLEATVVGRFGSGQSVLRTEDEALLKGAGRYTDDIKIADGLVLGFLRSPYAHAKLVSLDTNAAQQAQGIVAVYTGEQLLAAGVKPIAGVAGFKRPDGSAALSPARTLLCTDRVRYVGEPIAAVIGRSREQVKDAIELIEFEAETLPSYACARDAMAPDAVSLVEGATDNLCAQTKAGDPQAVAQAFSQAAHVVELELTNQRVVAASIEPRSVLATWETQTERLVIHLSSQMPAGARNTFSDVLGLPKDKVRVLVGDVGGGFGMKTGIYPEEAVAAYAAKQLKQSVRWVAERSEEMLSTYHGRDLYTKAAMALDANGKVTGLRLHSLGNAGAYAAATGVAIQVLIGPWVTTSVYNIANIDFTFQVALSNTATTSAYRGAGRPEAIYIIERLMDAAARQMNLDPAELRRRNLIAPEQMPFKNAMGQTYDTGNFPLILEKSLPASDYAGFTARAQASADKGLLRGRSIVTFLEWTGGNQFEERVLVSIKADGIIELELSTQAMGQGLATTYAQLAVDRFQVPIEKIRVKLGDSDRVQGFGSAGSRSLFTGGSALQVAADRAIEQAKELAADQLEVNPRDVEYAAGELKVVGTDKTLGLFELAAQQSSAQLFTDSTSAVSGPSWPNACHVVEVDIDPTTGELAIDRYYSLSDIGRVVNPMIVQGQVEGGAVQGIGQAVCEQVIYDPDSGQLLTGSFMDYAMPRADVYGPFITQFEQSVPSKNNPLGVKGVGELGTIGATPAVVNAVFDALLRAGVPQQDVYAIQMPVTTEKIWQALQQRQQ